MSKSGTTQIEALSLLADSTCRAILEAAATEPVSVPELIDQCDVPTSTAYRKVRQLVEADLLDERTRIRQKRRNLSEYLLREGELTLAIDGAGELSFDYEGDISDRVEDCSEFSDEVLTTPRVSTNGGGDPKEDTDAGERGHRGPFVDVIGVEEVIDISERVITSFSRTDLRTSKTR